MPTDDSQFDMETLRADHTSAAVAQRIAGEIRQSYLRDFVYGAIDGCVTTFAIVSGVVGANLDLSIVLILGTANVLADGFSMAVSNYLGTKTSVQMVHRAREIEEMHVDRIPDGEIEEVREIFRRKGFEGELLDRVVDVITGDRGLWIDTMVREEWGLSLSQPSPWKAAWVTFAAFLAAGLVPLLPFAILHALGSDGQTAFVISSAATGATFFGIGALKSRYVAGGWFRAGLETFLVGGGAALLAFVVGWLLKGLAGG